MRIIITKNGEYIIKQFEDEKSEILNNKNIYNGLSLSPKLPRLSNIKSIREKLLNPSKTFYPSSSLRKSKRNKSIRMMNEYFNRDESKINQKELEKAKKITISKSKVVISQKFLEKYHNSDSSFKEKLDNLSNLLSTHKDKNKNEELNSDLTLNPYKLRIKDNLNVFNKTTNSFRKNRKIKIGDIISKPNLHQLKSYIAKDNKGCNDVRVPLDKNNIYSFNFRSKYENKKEVKENLDVILNVRINSDRTNLINYLKQSKNISPYYFKNLLKYDESQIYKLNKMCGIILNNEKNKNFSEKKIINKNIKNKILEKSSEGLFSLLSETNKILNDYSEYKKCQNNIRKKGFREMIKNIKRKYWDKFHIHNLNNKRKKKEFEDSDIDDNIYDNISNL